MIFGKYINKYYLKYGPVLLLGLVALALVDYMQLVVPRLYQMVVNGMNDGFVTVDNVQMKFDMPFLLNEICLPMIVVVVSMVFGRFLWRVCFFGSAIWVETDIRNAMFDHCKDLSQQFYQVNKVGNMMSLFTNDLDTVQDCYGSGLLMLADALMLGVMSMGRMFDMDLKLTLLALIPMAFLFAISMTVGRYMEKKWDIRQEAFSKLSDFSQESFSGISVTSRAKQLGTWRISNYTPEYRETSGVGKRKLMTMDEVLRMDIDKALVILRGKKVLEVDKYDYSKHPEAKKLRPAKAASHIPAWQARIREDGKPVENDAPPPPARISGKAVKGTTRPPAKRPAAKSAQGNSQQIVSATKESILSKPEKEE